ncbi:hypothetical protein [Kitasatospora sp. NPDC001683]
MARLHAMLAPVHGLPVELATTSQRDFLEEEARRADVVVFTGACRNAEQVRARHAPGQLFLFLGSGVNPFVVAPGADLTPYQDEQALAAVLTTRMFTKRALGSSVYGRAPDLVKALSRRTTVTTDTTLLATDDGNAPFGGYGRQANYITDGTGQWVEPILISKAVAEHLPEGRP